ncbi:hypothetical protein OSO01_45450 [Oceanobacillus sojae]|uniref:Uncharacterized protein n=1 Tax=Oceanobacillus sojae TaxID=582851 RepID=A0A511ZQS4_9BACI|nr:hypothetical protein OSO01_45450 [Oceanobacillus sojae]
MKRQARHSDIKKKELPSKVYHSFCGTSVILFFNFRMLLSEIICENIDEMNIFTNEVWHFNIKPYGE